MAKCFETVRDVNIEPQGLSTSTFELSPIDLHTRIGETYLSMPLFFKHELDADRLLEAIQKLCVKYPLLCGRLRPHLQMRYVIEVNPEDRSAFGFPFSEIRADMTIATAIQQHSQVHAMSGVFPSIPRVPFFIETLDPKALVKGACPITRVRLTHFSDGCALTVTVSHTVLDGERYFELYRDLGQLYRGHGIADRDHDRSRLWPDQLAKHFGFLGNKVAIMPRSAAHLSDEFITDQKTEWCHMESLYFSKDVLKQMKKAVQAFLLPNAFISTNDLMIAMAWMLRSEITVDSRSTEDRNDPLDISDTMATSTCELIQNGCDFIPKNFLGNAYVFLFLSSQGLDFKSASLTEILAKLTSIMRKTVTDFRAESSIRAQSILSIYSMTHTGVLPLDMSRCRVNFTSMAGVPLQDIDFGQGPPKIALTMTTMPPLEQCIITGTTSSNRRGMLMNIMVSESRLARLKNSRVLQEIAPGVKFLHSQMSSDDVEAMMQE